MLDHVEDKQSAHPIVGEALPHFGGEQEGEPARVVEQVAAAAGLFDRDGGTRGHARANAKGKIMTTR
jgi:hypothetical protein